MQRFIREGEVLFALFHPCIVRIVGFNLGDEKHPPALLLSLEPKSLESAIMNKELSCAAVNKAAVELVLGMRYIHRRGFMHRDLKPSNVLLSRKNHVRISDFGLAKEEDIESSQSKGVGTLRFMAPELFEESDEETRYTKKVDVYSFGITLIFIVCGSYPKFSLKNVSIGKLPELPKTLVSWVRDLITRCLSHSPRNRPSFDEIFDIMKSNGYDMFHEHSNDAKLKRDQRNMIAEIEARVLKIEAFEYQHQT